MVDAPVRFPRDFSPAHTRFIEMAPARTDIPGRFVVASCEQSASAQRPGRNANAKRFASWTLASRAVTVTGPARPTSHRCRAVRRPAVDGAGQLCHHPSGAVEVEDGGLVAAVGAPEHDHDVPGVDELADGDVGSSGRPGAGTRRRPPCVLVVVLVVAVGAADFRLQPGLAAPA